MPNPLTTESREQRLNRMITARWQGEVFARTQCRSCVNKYAFGTDEWFWWSEGFEQERLRQELQRVHAAAGLGRMSEAEKELDASEPQPRGLWERIKWEWSFFRWFFDWLWPRGNE